MGETNIVEKGLGYANSVFDKYKLPNNLEYIKDIISEAFITGYNLRDLEAKSENSILKESEEDNKVKVEKEKFLVAYKVPYGQSMISDPNNIFTRVVELAKPINFGTIKQAVESTGESVSYVISWSKIEE